MTEIVQFVTSRRHRATARGYCIAILIGAVLAAAALAFKGTLVGWLVWVMFLAGALSFVWDFATKERGR
jgi:hypothetical protein